MQIRRGPTATWSVAAVGAAVAAATLVLAVDRPAPGPAAPRPLAAQLTPTPRAAPEPVDSVEVNGSRVPAVGTETVGSALRAAGVQAPAGAYLAVVTQRRLSVAGPPARITVDGRAATLDTTIRPGDDVVVRPGSDRVEPTELSLVHTWSPGTRSALYVGGRPGLVRVVRGSLSGEVVSRRVLRRPQVGHLVRRGAVALTFDDGPDPVWTPRLLRLLRRHHARATFCVIGREAAAHPRLIRAIARDGNALCDHTWDHDIHLAKRTAGRITRDVHRAALAIQRAGADIRATFFRPPGGRWSPTLRDVVRRAGLTPLGWTVDPRDWTRPGLRSILHTVSAELRPGGVILLHDGGGDRTQTLRAVRILLHKLRKQGYHFVVPPTR